MVRTPSRRSQRHTPKSRMERTATLARQQAESHGRPPMYNRALDWDGAVSVCSLGHARRQSSSCLHCVQPVSIGDRTLAEGCLNSVQALAQACLAKLLSSLRGKACHEKQVSFQNRIRRHYGVQFFQIQFVGPLSGTCEPAVFRW